MIEFLVLAGLTFRSLNKRAQAKLAHLEDERDKNRPTTVIGAITPDAAKVNQ